VSPTRTKRLAALAAGVLALAGCRPAEVQQQPRATDSVAPSVKLALLPPSREGNAALKVGRLEVDGPCLYVVGADGSRTIPAFMTFDTRWENGELVVESKRFRPGQTIHLGGGEINSKIADLAWVQQPDPSCTAPSYWITSFIDHG